MAKKPILTIKTSGKALKESERWVDTSDPEIRKLANEILELCNRTLSSPHVIDRRLDADPQDRKELIGKIVKQLEAEAGRSAGGRARAEKTRARDKRIVELRDEGKSFRQIPDLLALEDFVKTVKKAVYLPNPKDPSKPGEVAVKDAFKKYSEAAVAKAYYRYRKKQ